MPAPSSHYSHALARQRRRRCGQSPRQAIRCREVDECCPDGGLGSKGGRCRLERAGGVGHAVVHGCQQGRGALWAQEHEQDCRGVGVGWEGGFGEITGTQARTVGRLAPLQPTRANQQGALLVKTFALHVVSPSAPLPATFKPL